MLQSLITTIAHRPYVLAFLLTFLVIAILNRGPARTLLLLAIGYAVAFLSEYSSIRNGFPYGWYHYVYENLQGELILGGVPVWDSLSYTFIAYASYEMAEWIHRKFASNFVLRISGLAFPAFLMTLLDVVIDPLAVRGDQWFLGKIFYYPHGGLYFGVPLSNFAGWFLIALSILSLYHLLEKRYIKAPSPLRVPFLGPLFYGGILAFNLAITFWIGETTLGLVGLALHGIVITSTFVLSARSRQRKDS